MRLLENYKEYNEFIKALKGKLDSSRVRIEQQYEKALIFNFIGSFQIIVLPQAFESDSKDWPLAYFSSSIIIYDKGFKNLKKALNNQTVDMYFDILPAIIHSFSKKPNNKYYKSLPYPLKKDLEKKLKLKVNADREYFLFGNDELRPRYKESHPVQLKKKQKVKIIDDSAIVLNLKTGERYIDVHSTMSYSDSKYIYREPNLTKRVQVETRDESTSTYHANDVVTFFKDVLRDDVDLSKVKNKIRYHKVDGKEFELIKKDDEFFLKDNKGLIAIHHPDLLVYLV